MVNILCHAYAGQSFSHPAGLTSTLVKFQNFLGTALLSLR